MLTYFCYFKYSSFRMLDLDVGFENVFMTYDPSDIYHCRNPLKRVCNFRSQFRIFLFVYSFGIDMFLLNRKLGSIKGLA